MFDCVYMRMLLKHDITGMIDNLYGCDGQVIFATYILLLDYLEVEIKFLAFA